MRPRQKTAAPRPHLVKVPGPKFPQSPQERGEGGRGHWTGAERCVRGGPEGTSHRGHAGRKDTRAERSGRRKAARVPPAAPSRSPPLTFNADAEPPHVLFDDAHRTPDVGERLGHAGALLPSVQLSRRRLPVPGTVGGVDAQRVVAQGEEDAEPLPAGAAQLQQPAARPAPARRHLPRMPSPAPPLRHLRSALPRARPAELRAPRTAPGPAHARPVGAAPRCGVPRPWKGRGEPGGARRGLAARTHSRPAMGTAGRPCEGGTPRGSSGRSGVRAENRAPRELWACRGGPE